jgi:hypothetical protein
VVEGGGGGIRGVLSDDSPVVSIAWMAVKRRSIPSSSAPSFWKRLATRTSRSDVVLPRSISRSTNASNEGNRFAS